VKATTVKNGFSFFLINLRCLHYKCNKLNINDQLSRFISSNLEKSYSQYLNTVDATKCTFCFFNTSIICICFLIPINKSFICLSSLFVVSAISSERWPFFYIAFIFKSFRFWVNPFSLIWPFVSCCNTLFLSLLAVATLLIGLNLRFTWFLTIFWEWQCFSVFCWLLLSNSKFSYCSSKSAWNIFFPSAHSSPLTQSTLEFNSLSFPKPYPTLRSPLHTV